MKYHDLFFYLFISFKFYFLFYLFILFYYIYIYIYIFFFLKIGKDVAKIIVCCSPDWRFRVNYLLKMTTSSILLSQ